eukprot:Phypoly_transcript_15303.p1 GENE.Phypoly_transcript_15303~~Phypoly_transcript_15303.p1  ORF type:complete len:284 (+),score=9.51 Phypoly_transcript_15303:41-853(+)
MSFFRSGKMYKAPSKYTWTDEWLPRRPTFIDPNRNQKDPRLLQGSLGDCWLLAALEVIPWRFLQNMFIGSSPGKVTVRLFGTDGTAWEITVTLSVPCVCTGASCVPAYVQPANPNEIWGPIVEKAMATLLCEEQHRALDYRVLNGGDPAVAFKMVTGLPAETFAFSGLSPDTVWNKLVVSRCPECAVGVAGTPPHELEQDGIVGNHAYAILGTREQRTSRLTRRFVRLRNPWGREEWKGECSDPIDDGIFDMPFDAFLTHFAFASICYLK